MTRYKTFFLLIVSFPIGLFAQEVDFNRDIRPLLSDRCFSCHGPDSEHREADLRLDIEKFAKESAISEGDVAGSELVARIISDDEDLLMPPADSNKELSPKEIDLIKRWIKQGAKWSDHWAYVPPKKSPEPKVANKNWKRNWIDSFVLKKLESSGLSPAPDTEPVSLVRRVHFELDRTSAIARNRCKVRRRSINHKVRTDR